MQQRAQDTEIIDLCCDFLLTTVKALAGGDIDIAHLF